MGMWVWSVGMWVWSVRMAEGVWSIGVPVIVLTAAQTVQGKTCNKNY